MLELHGYFEFDQSQDDPFLYPLLFRDGSPFMDLRGIMLSLGLLFDSSSSTKKFNYGIVNRFIHRMYDLLVISPTYSTQNPFLGHNPFNVWIEVLVFGHLIIIIIYEYYMKMKSTVKTSILIETRIELIGRKIDFYLWIPSNMQYLQKWSVRFRIN